MRKFAPILAVVAVLAVGCGESEPSVDERRVEACEAFAALSPGSLEMSDDIDILSDPGASNREQSEALKRQLDWKAGRGRDHPYDCDLPSDQELFERHFGPFGDD